MLQRALTVGGGSGGGNVDMGFGSTFANIQHLNDSSSAISGTNKIVCGFKPKKILISCMYNKLYDDNLFYDADIDDTKCYHYESSYNSSASTPDVYSVPNSNGGICLNSIENDGFTVGSNISTYAKNISYMAIG